jgi:hypothetical protein
MLIWGPLAPDVFNAVPRHSQHSRLRLAQASHGWAREVTPVLK